MDPKIEEMKKQYARIFRRDPEWEAHAPGRVNLIGEHTDYNGCPVLPMALELDFTALFSGRDDGEIRIRNLDPAFPSRRFEAAREIPPYDTGDWGNYCKAGVQAMTARTEAAAVPGGGPAPGQDYRGMDVLLCGRIPPAAGLSSSSALVVVSGLIFNTVNGTEVPYSELAGILAEGEQYVGTKGGGMDQAASLLSEKGKALKIDFSPFRFRTVDMPGDCTVIVADTLVQAPKTRETMDKYNLRTIECALGVELLDRAFSRAAASSRGEPAGKVFLRLLGDITEENLGMPWDEIWDIIEGALSEGPCSVSEVAEALSMPAEKVKERFFVRKDGSFLPEPEQGLQIRRRVIHILEERERVEESAEALERGDLIRFGELMDDSHRSCRDLYEISCPELDRLASDLRASGALGARLTGAGFGGCAIGLSPDDKAEEIIAGVKTRYYRDYLGAEERAAIFPCKPGPGARVKKL